jgi:hypothetical protein
VRCRAPRGSAAAGGSSEGRSRTFNFWTRSTRTEASGRSTEFDTPSIEILLIVGDVGVGDEGVAGASFDPKIDASRIVDSARLDGGDSRIDGNCGEMASATCAPTRPPRRIAIAADALAVGDDMQVGHRQLANQAADLAHFRVLVLVVVAQDDVDRVNAVCIEEDFTETGAVEHAITV